jgi:hypothetical protein
MTAQVPVKVAAAFAVVCVMCLSSLLGFYQVSNEFAANMRDPFEVNVMTQGLSGAAAMIPAGEKVGYFAQVSIQDGPGMLAFASARYVLAPRLLYDATNGASPGWVIGNFSEKSDFAEEGQRRGLSMVKDFGNGIVLYRKEGR